MEKTPELINVADELYNKLKQLVEKMYSLEGENLNHTKEEVFDNFNKYMQACFFLIAISDHNFVNEEVAFIEKLTNNNTAFTEEQLALFNQKTEEERKTFVDSVFAFVKEIPYFVELSVLCDKAADAKMIILKPTYSQIVYDNLKRLTTYMKFVDNQVLTIEDEMNNKIISPIRTYYRSSYVKFARERKED